MRGGAAGRCPIDGGGALGGAEGLAVGTVAPIPGGGAVLIVVAGPALGRAAAAALAKV